MPVHLVLSKVHLRIIVIRGDITPHERLLIQRCHTTLALIPVPIVRPTSVVIYLLAYATPRPVLTSSPPTYMHGIFAYLARAKLGTNGMLPLSTSPPAHAPAAVSSTAPKPVVPTSRSSRPRASTSASRTTFRLMWFRSCRCRRREASAAESSTRRRFTSSEDHAAEAGAVCAFSILKYFFLTASVQQHDQKGNPYVSR